MILQTIFWVSVILIVYAYFGYPLLLLVLSMFSNHPVRRAEIRPSVSFIITAYNEEGRIREKIENTLGQNYPRSKLEIIVASDGSTDRTEEVVSGYKTAGVKLVRNPGEKGKESAQKYALEKASGEVIIFSDVATRLQPNGIATLVRNFNDPTVGCVSSVDRFEDPDGKLSGEGLYVRYEMLLRSLETKVSTLVGLSGSLFAARREVCADWPIDCQSDFNTLLNSVKLGLRGVSDPDSIGYYRNIVDERKEFERKVRTVLRGISVFMKNLSLLNPFKYGFFSWELISHKLCRWCIPVWLITLLMSNILIILCSQASLLFLVILAAQVLLYGCALAGFVSSRLQRYAFVKLPVFLVQANASILVAWVRYLSGERLLHWEPSKR